MIKFINRMTKEEFFEVIQWHGQKIEPIESSYKSERIWKVTDKYDNEWKIVFTGNVNEFTISSEQDPVNPFKVYMLLNGDRVEIHKAMEYKRNITSERLLRKYSRIATMVSCYHRFGYLKI